MSETAVSAETSAASSAKLAPHAVIHHSALTVQKSITAATRKAADSWPVSRTLARGASIGCRRLNANASSGTANEASSAARQPAPTAAASESAPTRITYAKLANTFASVSATARQRG